MKKTLRIFFAFAAFLVMFNVFWLGHGLAQGVTYTDTVTATFTGNHLNHPTGLAYSADLASACNGLPNGNASLLIADSGNHLIRAFLTNTGTLCTIAGNGTAGYVNNTVLNSEFQNPTGIDVLGPFSGYSSGRHIHYWSIVYISDSSNYVLRYFCTGYAGLDTRCPETGVVWTLAGNASKGYVNGSPTTASFAHLGGMHSAYGFAVDSENHVIRTVGSTIGTLAGTGSPGFVNGPRASAQFNYPTKLAKDSSGNIYVADAGNNAIRKIDTSGNVTTLAGSGIAGNGDGTGGAAEFQLPSGIVYNSNDNALYVADTGNNVIRRITLTGVVTTYAGNHIGGFVNSSLLQSEFHHPTDIVVLGTNLVVSDTYNNAIRLINTSTGTVSTLID
jgi:NHL repeat